MTREEREQRARAQEERAKRSLDAIFQHGANPGDEAMQLANEYTDAQSGRFRAWLGRILHHG